MSTSRLFVVLSGGLGALGVAAGAFGAHALRTRLEPRMLEVFETAVRYHLIHAVAILGAAFVAERWGGALATAAGWSFAAGIVVFSGSLYALTLTGVRWLGAITPLGGLALIVGWGLLAAAAWRGA